MPFLFGDGGLYWGGFLLTMLTIGIGDSHSMANCSRMLVVLSITNLIVVLSSKDVCQRHS